MGWSNFILIHKDKIALECSRHFESANYIDNHENDLLNKFNEFNEKHSESELAIVPFKDISIEDVSEMFKAFDLIRQYDDETFFYLLLKERYGAIEVVHESKVPKGYKRIVKNLE